MMDYKEQERLEKLAEDLNAKNQEVKFSDIYPHKPLLEKKKKFTVKK